MRNFFKKAVVGVCTFCVLWFLWNLWILTSPLEKVQSGEYKLECVLVTGVKTIDPAKVEDYLDGTWLFTNGYSRNCKVLKL